MQQVCVSLLVTLLLRICKPQGVYNESQFMCFDQTVFNHIFAVIGNILEGNIFTLHKKSLSPIGAIKRDHSYGSVEQSNVERCEAKEEDDTTQDGMSRDVGVVT